MFISGNNIILGDQKTAKKMETITKKRTFQSQTEPYFQFTLYISNKSPTILLYNYYIIDENTGLFLANEKQRKVRIILDYSYPNIYLSENLISSKLQKKNSLNVFRSPIHQEKLLIELEYKKPESIELKYNTLIIYDEIDNLNGSYFDINENFFISLNF